VQGGPSPTTKNGGGRGGGGDKKKKTTKKKEKGGRGETTTFESWERARGGGGGNPPPPEKQEGKKKKNKSTKFRKKKFQKNVPLAKKKGPRLLGVELGAKKKGMGPNTSRKGELQRLGKKKMKKYVWGPGRGGFFPKRRGCFPPPPHGGQVPPKPGGGAPVSRCEKPPKRGAHFCLAPKKLPKKKNQGRGKKKGKGGVMTGRIVFWGKGEGDRGGAPFPV